MKFFLPHGDSENTEPTYAAIAKFVGVNAPVNFVDRICALSWIHNGKQMSCTVGEPMPSYYQTGDEPVLAIFKGAGVFIICTPSRGGVRGDPILAEFSAQVENFSE
jgi:hypothetical protein